MKCAKCGLIMKIVGSRTVMCEMDEDFTAEQAAAYRAAQESGDFGDWAILETTYKCSQCEGTIVKTSR